MFSDIMLSAEGASANKSGLVFFQGKMAGNGREPGLFLHSLAYPSSTT